MDTDYAVPSEVDRIRARVFKLVEDGTAQKEVETWNSVFALAEENGPASNVYTLPATFGILAAEGDVDREIVIELEALAPLSDSPLVARRVRTGFVLGETRLLRIVLYQACEDVRCGSGQSCACPGEVSCAAPECVDETVPAADLETIDDPRALPPDAGIPIPDAGVPDAGVPPDGGGIDPDGGGINCGPPLTLCGLDCVNTNADPRYCGDCETECPSGSVCESGDCVNPGDCRNDPSTCTGFSYCDESSGECVPGCTETSQCEGDNQVCDPELRDCVCADGFESCQSGCVDTQRDPSFCGNCSTSCPTGFVCEAGECFDAGDCRTNGIGCSGFTYCDGASGNCLPGCELDEQCPEENEVCDLGIHDCVCDDDFERCDQGCCPTSCPPGQALYDGTCAELHLQTADGQGDRGEHSSIALDANGSAHIAYYGKSGRNLIYAEQGPGASWVSESPDGPDDVGKYTSIALNSAGVVHIAYFNESDKTLMFARRESAGVWTIEVVDDNSDVGEYASLAFDAADVPHISYYDKSNKDLMYARRLGDGFWNIETVDGDGDDDDDDSTDVGQHTSIGVEADGRVHISYYASTGRNLKYATRSGTGSWTTRTVDTNGDVGKYSSIAIDGLGRVYISYYDESNKDLRYASQFILGFWATEAVDSAGDVGKYSSLALDDLGRPRISYYDEDGKDLKYAVQENGQAWTLRSLDTDDDVGRYTSIAVDDLGQAHISYYDSSDKSLKYALVAAPD